LKYRAFIQILTENGFVLDRQRGSHGQYEGTINGKRSIVTVSGQPNDDILPKNLASMIRQSGLSKKLFR
jgi:predicted RNA binding protein YcfA (HicA-like mRNA interferase family)